MACSSIVPTFPANNAIPAPFLFVGMGGLAAWLNQNPTYKSSFVNTGYFPTLIPSEFITSSLSSAKYSYENVPLCSEVTQLSQGQARLYNQQLALFHKVYTFNSNAYVTAQCTGIPPMYYTFRDYQELNNYRSAAQVANKLAPFQVMAQASTSWTAPFPVLF
jgi:hypothetical protein